MLSRCVIAALLWIACAHGTNAQDVVGVPRWTADGNFYELWNRQRSLIARPGSGYTSDLTAAEAAVFGKAVADVAFRRNLAAAQSALASLGVRLYTFYDGTYGEWYFLIRELRKPGEAGFRGFGTYMVHRQPQLNVAGFAPHEPFDLNTSEQVRRFAQRHKARIVGINGLHRCASSALSGCDGSTRACSSKGGPYRKSDFAHNPSNPFVAVVKALDDEIDLVVDFHGKATTTDAPYDVIVSDGTLNVAAASTLSNRISTAIRAAGTFNPASCNEGLPVAMCGETNVYGRILNGQTAHACTVQPAVATGKFIHIEQNGYIRSSKTLTFTLLDTVVGLLH